MNSHDPLSPDSDLVADLESLYGINVPTLTFVIPQSSTDRVARGRGGRWRGLAFAVAAAAMLAAIVAVPSTWGGKTSTVSAQQIFDRAAASAAASAGSGESYHLVASFEGGTQPGKQYRGITETWYLDPTHQRTETRTVDPNESSLWGTAREGSQAWAYLEISGSLRAARFPVVDEFAWFQPRGESLEAVLRQYSESECEQVTLVRDDTLGGRTVHVLTVSVTAHSCPRSLEKRSIVKEGMDEQLTLWVDTETFLPLRLERTDGEGDVAYRYEVTLLELGPEFADAPYAPPGTALVADVADAGEAKTFIAGVLPPAGPNAK